VNPTDSTEYRAVILDPADSDDAQTLDRLRSDPRVQILDHYRTDLDNLSRLRPSPGAELLNEPGRWAWYPWRRSVVSVLGPNGFRTLRLDRNRNGITAEEQLRLGELTIGVAGLSVGHVIAHTLAAQGLCSRLRLADFDRMELSNLNRVPATVFDLGVNKAVVAARRVAELDPYISVEVYDAGLTAATVDDFLDGLNILVEECDSLDIKALARVGAKSRHIPVLMATSDRGIVDVERFDLEPDREILHGLLGALDIALLPGMSSKEKMPHVLRHLESELLSPRTAASLIELDRSLSTWPQMASDVVIGASAVAEAVRRIGLGEELRSGRCRIDIGWALDQLAEPDMAAHQPAGQPPAARQPAATGAAGLIALAALRAPSGGNTQPWHVDVGTRDVTISIEPALTSTMDVAFRGSAVSLGAAVFNAKAAAAAHHVLGPVSFTDNVAGTPLQATLHLGSERSDDIANLYGPVLERETNRNKGTATALHNDTVVALTEAAEQQSANLRLLIERDDIAAAATILAAADRIRFLTPHLHREMISELRWPGDPDPDAGIEVGSLGLDEGDLTVLGLLRRSDVMAHLADWNEGSALGDDMSARVHASSALAIITVPGDTLRDYAIGGAAVEAVWVQAQQLGLTVQPVSPPFLYARTQSDLKELSERFAGELGALQSEFVSLTGIDARESIALILRLASAEPTTVTSRRSHSRIRIQDHAG
jgi:molybdopterin/thiamine biosynthesis adenylyltransferase